MGDVYYIFGFDILFVCEVYIGCIYNVFIMCLFCIDFLLCSVV